MAKSYQLLVLWQQAFAMGIISHVVANIDDRESDTYNIRVFDVCINSPTGDCDLPNYVGLENI